MSSKPGWSRPLPSLVGIVQTITVLSKPRDCISSLTVAIASLSARFSSPAASEPSNSAAWLEKAKDRPLVVREAPYKSPGKGQILIKNAAVAVNPIDWKIQDLDVFSSTYPLVLGSDAAGEIVEVGEGVTGFSVGDRVLAHTSGPGSKDNAQGGFQRYSISLSTVTAHIPKFLPYHSAVVLGLGTATAAAGLYQKEYLALDLPSASIAHKTKGVVIVWGGSSSVGSCAIQLAANSGYEVIATAGKDNLKYVKEIGAAEAFDYRSRTLVDDIEAALQGKKLAGSYDAIALPATLTTLAQIVSRTEGSKLIAHTAPGRETPGLPEGVVLKGVSASSIACNEVGPAVFNDFLPEALAAGKYLAKPEARVIGHGLDYVQDGLDKNKAGVSAAKIVITL